MFSGIEITISNESFTVPPISLGMLRTGMKEKLRQHDALVAEGKTFESVELRGEMILAALRRNYPDFEEKKLYDYLDMANTGPIWLSILGASGFTPGEVKAAGNGISDPSTEASPPHMDGPIAK